MKIFDGFVEIDIVPWFECEDCAKHLPFPGYHSAHLFVQRFKTYHLAMDSLRLLIRARGQGLSREIFHDEEVLEQAAQMLARGELHATRKPLDFRRAVARPTQAGLRPQPATSPAPRPPTAAPPPPPPEEPVLLPNADPDAIAAVLTNASQSGVPFCEE